MSASRFRKICYMSDIELLDNCSKRATTVRKNSWIEHMKSTLTQINYGWVCGAQSIITLRNEKQNILIALSNLLFNEDTLRIIKSSYNPDYKFLLTSSLYFNYSTPLRGFRTIIQLRTINHKLPQIYHNAGANKFRPEVLCSVCKKLEEDSIAYFLSHCPIFATMVIVHQQIFINRTGRSHKILRRFSTYTTTSIQV